MYSQPYRQADRWLSGPSLSTQAQDSVFEMTDSLVEMGFEGPFQPAEDYTPPPTPNLPFATLMAEQIEASASLSSKKGRRDRLFALFGSGAEEAGDAPPTLASPPPGLSDPGISPASAADIENKLEALSALLRAENTLKMNQDSGTGGVARDATMGGQKMAELAASAMPKLNENVLDPRGKGKMKATIEDSEDEDISSDSNSDKSLTPTQSSKKLSIHRHKRAGTAFKIIDQQSADAVILPSSSYIAPDVPSRGMQLAKEPEPETVITEAADMQKNLVSKPSDLKQKPEDEISILPSTSFYTPASSHGVLKAQGGEEKKPNDKKVRFVAAPAAEADEDCDSDDSDTTLKAGVGGMKAVASSSLSPAIWGKGSEPKIYMKDGKPTLFQPTKEPGYYTCPLWSRQYPEILSNDPGNSAYVAEAASSSASQGNARSTAGPSNNTGIGRDANTQIPGGNRFTKTIRSTINSQPTIGPNTLILPPTPPGFTYPPRFRNRVVLEVGGRRYTSSIDVLSRSPYFQHMFAIPFLEWYRDGVLHIDNDPDLFAHILRYLRTGSYPLFWNARTGFDYPLYAMVMQQAQYYLLPQLEAWIADGKYVDVVEQKVLHRKIDVAADEDWYVKRTLEVGESFEISGVASRISSGMASVSIGGEASQGGLGKRGDDVGSDGDTLEQDSVQVFTTSKKLKVNMGLLRCEFESQFS
ncbi:hypothetical protein CPLU01_00605 [Colletotrichum plurivorum]|uniref:BTB domain-containing protein n=1 Tax=Colletotrichum plurivorum TaxID=2175906 RepID=A0A8H6NRY5_9PEZI|nr:hypothetical protein CPLU01_00605 [Colletotrichum plurivorum]